MVPETPGIRRDSPMPRAMIFKQAGVMAYALLMGKRNDKDRRTLEAIGRIYCVGNHGNRPRDAAGLCLDCRQTVDVTLRRTEACPFGHEGNCQDCTVHCQRGDAQARIRAMMRYAAPRMALRHPVMTADYLRKKLARGAGAR